MLLGSILGGFWVHFGGRFRDILDTQREPARNNEKLKFGCYLLYFRHVADPANDAISEYVHVCLVVFFFKALFWDPHVDDFCDFWCPLGALLGHFWLTSWGHFSGLRRRGSGVIR